MRFPHSPSPRLKLSPQKFTLLVPFSSKKSAWEIRKLDELTVIFMDCKEADLGSEAAEKLYNEKVSAFGEPIIDDDGLKARAILDDHSSEDSLAHYLFRKYFKGTEPVVVANANRFDGKNKRKKQDNSGKVEPEKKRPTRKGKARWSKSKKDDQKNLKNLKKPTTPEEEEKKPTEEEEKKPTEEEEKKPTTPEEEEKKPTTPEED